MEQTIFERPREKLQHSGVTALTNAELLQIIIGSGSARMPVAKIARRVSQALLRIDVAVTLASLIDVPGMGMANASRVIASLELGKRLSVQSPNRSHTLDTTKLQTSRRKTILYATLSGDGSVIQTYSEVLKQSEGSTVLARRLCAQVLSDNAWGISIAIGSSKAQDQPAMFELGLVSDLQAIAKRLQVKLVSAEYIAKTTQTYMYRSPS